MTKWPTGVSRDWGGGHRRGLCSSSCPKAKCGKGFKLVHVFDISREGKGNMGHPAPALTASPGK